MDCSTPGFPDHHQFPESLLCIRWPNYWSFSFSISPSNEYSGLISFRIYWLISLQSKGSPRVFSNTKFKSINSVLSFLYSPTLTSIHDYWKTKALTRQTFAGKVMSLLFNMLSRLVIAFISRSKHLLIHGCSHHLQWFWSPPKWNLSLFPLFPHHLPWVTGLDVMILVFWMFSFKPTFSLSSFTFIKRLFSSSSLSAIRLVSSVYLRLLIFLLEILIPACASFSPAFLMMCSAYKLNKQGDNIQPWCSPFLIWKQSVLPCPVLTVASWPAYRFIRRPVRWSGISISLRSF